MALGVCFRTAKTICINVKVFVDTSRSRSHLFLTAPGGEVKQCCLVSYSQQSWSLQPPKKPAGAFLKFLNQKSQEIISKSPDATPKERCKIAGHLWRNLDPKEKNRLKLGAREELQVYRQQYSSFVDQLNSQERAQLMQERKEKRIARALHRHKMELQRLGRPKRPPNSFNLFVKVSRSQLSHADPPNFLKGLVESWKQMSEEDKAIYQANARVQKEKYEEAMTQWEQKMKEMGRQDLIRRKSLGKVAPSSKTNKDITLMRQASPKSKSGFEKTHPKTKDNVDKRGTSEE